MKKRLFTEIIDETVIELDVDFEDTVERLIDQEGICRTTDSQDIPFIFDCDGKGRFSVFNAVGYRSDFAQRIYSVEGEVKSEDGKTKVYIYTLYDRSARWSRYFGAVLYLLFMVAYILFICFRTEPLQLFDFIFIAVYSLFIARIFFHTNKEKLNKTNDIEIMKSEIIRRVEAIKRWDD